ncbi:N-acetyltransferase [uncultured Enterococcus sp.]|uniref:GNAT family N-acetyltransferase n=1 Tax=uncultured Enterococcus sp. TaxID=167972 RepID=UPI002AA8F26A|nr:N-acetyltransferase [uncultured Enterococcus sp.]
MSYKIRALRSEEIYLLDTFIYEAIFQRPGVEKLPKSIIQQPDINVYIKDFGKKTDYCLVAESHSNVVGAVWTRILGGSTMGFGHLNNEIPEFALSVLEEFRGQGIGKSLMKHMLVELKRAGYVQASLAVQKDNYAFFLYKGLGFKIIDENEEEFIMLYQF